MQFTIEGNVLKHYDYDNQEEKVVIPDGIEEIGESAFYLRRKVKEIIIPDTVQKIGACAFSECGIESIIIPDSVTELKQEAFEEARELKKVILGNGITDLDSYLFRGCQNLEHLELSMNLYRVGYDSFAECYSLKTIWVNGTEYRIRDDNAPEPIKKVYESLEKIRQRVQDYYDSGAMDEFEYIDYNIAGDGYSY